MSTQSSTNTLVRQFGDAVGMVAAVAYAAGYWMCATSTQDTDSSRPDHEDDWPIPLEDLEE